MKELWEFCRRLSNPERLELLRRTCVKRDLGLGVNEAVDGSNLGQSAVSQYFKQLLELGILRRDRGGRCVGYSVDCSGASSSVEEITKMIYTRFVNGSRDFGFIDAFGVFGNAFRLAAIRLIAERGPLTKEQLSEKYDREIRFITRDLEPAVKGGILSLDADDPTGAYTYIPPSDEIARRVVTLPG